MTRRRTILYGLLAVFAMLLSTAVAWSCALWSPMPSSRSLPIAEATEVLTDGLGTSSFHSTPGGIQHSGIGVTFTLAGEASVAIPTREQLTARPTRRRRNNVSFSVMPSDPDSMSIQVIRAGWPLSCLEGAAKSVGSKRENDGVMKPPGILDNMGVKPRRLLPLYPRWTGMTVNAAVYCAVFWLAIPGPRAIRRYLRRRRAQCERCGYDLGHHDHDSCPECGNS
jgi:hypothetical protein